MGSTKTAELKPITPFVKRVKAKMNPEKMILFGSRARGDWLKTSDWDILIVSTVFRELNFHERVVSVLALMPAGSPAIEPFCLTPEEFAQQRNMLTIARTAVREGIEI